MIEINPKWQKAESIITTIACWAIGVVMLVLFMGLILQALSSHDIIADEFSDMYYDQLGSIIVIAVIVLVGLAIPGLIVSSKVPSREDIVDDQLLTILQRTKEIEKRLTQNEKEISEMEDQLRANMASPLVHVSQEKEQAIINKLRIVAKPKEGSDLFNRAATAQLLRAIQLLGYIDSAEKPNTLRLWVEQVTGYRNPDKSHFAEAYKRANEHSGNVATYMQEIG